MKDFFFAGACWFLGHLGFNFKNISQSTKQMARPDEQPQSHIHIHRGPTSRCTHISINAMVEMLKTQINKSLWQQA